MLPGTVIYAEKESNAQLTLINIDIQGTAEKPVVFTSNQPTNQRAPGDWQGISIGLPKLPVVQTEAALIANGNFRYVRIEYAGSSLAGVVKRPSTTFLGERKVDADPYGFALNFFLRTNANFNQMDHIQISYSAGGGFLFNTIDNLGSIFRYLIAYRCAGIDFKFAGNVASGVSSTLAVPIPSGTRIVLQYLLGLKDPGSYDGTESAGIQSSSNNITLSNATLISNYRGEYLPNFSGYGLRIGDIIEERKTGIIYGCGGFHLFNSIVTGSNLATISLNGYSSPANTSESSDNIPAGRSAWDIYGLPGSIKDKIDLRNNVFLNAPPANYPLTGGLLGKENYRSYQSGFDNVVSSDKTAALKQANYTELTPSQLGIEGLLNAPLNAPVLLPEQRSESPILTGASFPTNTEAQDPDLNKSVTFIGAFGSTDWTSPWANFDLKRVSY